MAEISPKAGRAERLKQNRARYLATENGKKVKLAADKRYQNTHREAYNAYHNAYYHKHKEEVQAKRREQRALARQRRELPIYEQACTDIMKMFWLANDSDRFDKYNINDAIEAMVLKYKQDIGAEDKEEAK